MQVLSAFEINFFGVCSSVLDGVSCFRSKTRMELFAVDVLSVCVLPKFTEPSCGLVIYAAKICVVMELYMMFDELCSRLMFSLSGLDF